MKAKRIILLSVFCAILFISVLAYALSIDKSSVAQFRQVKYHGKVKEKILGIIPRFPYVQYDDPLLGKTLQFKENGGKFFFKGENGEFYKAEAEQDSICRHLIKLAEND